MDDEFLKVLREDPRPEFARDLHRQLKAGSGDRGARTPRQLLFARWKPALAGCAALALAVTLVTSPSVRAAAQDFLDLFRVRKFAAVPLDPARLKQLQAGRIDIETLLADSLEVIKDPGAPRPVDSPEVAAQLAGIPLLQPTTTFTDQPVITVIGDRSARFTANVERLQGLADALGVDGVRVPTELDGAVVTLNVPSHVVMRYETKGRWAMTFVQSRSPEILLPAGTNLGQIGEIALRLTGMSADEAEQFAQSIDWNSTLLVPVPANAASFREVHVRGTEGLMITAEPSRSGQDRTAAADNPRSILMWSENGMVYSISGAMQAVDLLEMANAIR